MYFFLTTFTIWIMCHLNSGATYLGSQLFNASTSSSLREYCERENFEASCPPDHVVIMRSGRYGRMDVGRCVNTDYGHMGCEIDVLTELDRRCSGRKSCSFPVTELQEVGRPCPTDLMSYLEASYSCLPVIPCSEEQCAATHFVHVNPEDGYLSSAVAGETGCGTQRCPWLLEALPGQKVNLTAYYFSTQRIEEDPINPTPRLCHRFVTIRDNGLMKDLVSCEHEPRSIGTYVSQSHRVEVRMHTGGGPTEGSRNGAQITVGTAGGGTSANDVNFVQFVLKYEVIGCPLVRAPQHGYIALQSDSMVIVRCNHSEVSWRLMCLGTSWDSTVSSCPAGSAWEWQGSEGGTTSPHGMLIVIAIGIALGIAAGFLMLGLAVIYFKRRHMLTRHRIPIPQCDMHEPEKLMTSYPPIPEHKQEMIQTGNGTVTRPYVQHSVGGMKPVIPEYNVLTQDQAYHPGGGDGEKPCAFIYQGNNYGGGGGYTLAQHVYESPTFERKGNQPLNPSDFTNATGNNNTHNNNTHIVVNAANMNNSS